MSDMIKFNIPAGFITQQGIHLNDAELAYGFRKGWIEGPALVDICLSDLKAGRPLSDAQDALALLLPSDYYDVPELVDALERSATMSASEAARVWQFLAVAWLFDHAESLDEMDESIVLLAADFESPELKALYHPMPLVADTAQGQEHFVNKIKRYLDTTRDAFKARK